MLIQAKAIVSRGPHTEDGKWKIEGVTLRPLQDNELLVRVVASGICHTDIVFGDHPEGIGGWPRVMGHEGSGYVEQVGKNVTIASPGDPILLSFASCRTCKLCKDGHLSHCSTFWETNFYGNKTFSTTSSAEPDIIGCFFGQSSFASMTIANETSVVNVKGLVNSDEELKLFAPLGCGIQTGSGTVINVAQAKPSDSIAILGAGGVGLAAVMGGKIAGCHTVIVIDRVESRLELAKELGATSVFDTGKLGSLDDLVAEVRKLTDGYGVSICIDTTGVLALIEKGIEFTARRGTYIQVGSSPPDQVLKIPVQLFMDSGKRIIGAVEGQVVPQEYVPQMIEWYRQGKLPIDKFAKHYASEDFMSAIQGMHSGETIKPIILW